MAGGTKAFQAFADLVSLLLRLTVLKWPAGEVKLHYEGPNPSTRILGGWDGPLDPLPLRNARFLRLNVSLFLEATPKGELLKVRKSSYQYQFDKEGDKWVWRYDYLRETAAEKPPAHLQINGGFAFKDIVPKKVSLHKIHFPTDRVSLESVIRLLADQFGVPCNNNAAIWRPVLSESESRFRTIAHRPG